MSTRGAPGHVPAEPSADFQQRIAAIKDEPDETRYAVLAVLAKRGLPVPQARGEDGFFVEDDWGTTRVTFRGDLSFADVSPFLRRAGVPAAVLEQMASTPCSFEISTDHESRTERRPQRLYWKADWTQVDRELRAPGLITATHGAASAIALAYTEAAREAARLADSFRRACAFDHQVETVFRTEDGRRVFVGVFSDAILRTKQPDLPVRTACGAEDRLGLLEGIAQGRGKGFHHALCCVVGEDGEWFKGERGRFIAKTKDNLDTLAVLDTAPMPHEVATTLAGADPVTVERLYDRDIAAAVVGKSEAQIADMMRSMLRSDAPKSRIIEDGYLATRLMERPWVRELVGNALALNDEFQTMRARDADKSRSAAQAAIGAVMVSHDETVMAAPRRSRGFD